MLFIVQQLIHSQVHLLHKLDTRVEGEMYKNSPHTKALAMCIDIRVYKVNKFHVQISSRECLSSACFNIPVNRKWQPSVLGCSLSF